MNYQRYILSFFLAVCTLPSFAQDEADKILAEAETKEKAYTIATFKTTRVINFHTIETCGKRTLDFRIAHRFGTINSGAYNLWGIDGGASIRLGLEYSYDGRLMVGIGRSNVGKMFDGFAKYRLLRQTEDNSMPLSVTLFSGMYYTGIKDPLKSSTGFDRYEKSYSRMSFVHQVIAGRKFGEKLSLQVAPWFVHYNQVEGILDRNDMFGVAGALRYKITRSMAITAEYAFRANDYSERDYYDSFGLGFEIETGGHVFQMHVTNSFGLSENQFLPYTDTKWGDGGIRIGFNISRVFTI